MPSSDRITEKTRRQDALRWRSSGRSGKSTRKGLPESRPFDHAITLKPGFEPRRFKHYRLNPEETKLMNELVNTNLTNGFIVPSKSPMASPFFFVGKKEDGAL